MGFPIGLPIQETCAGLMMPWRAKYIVAAYTAPFLYALWIDLNFYRRLLPSAASAQECE